MGVDLHGLYCLLYARKFGVFGKTVTLGRQKISVSTSRLRSLFGDNVPQDSRYCEWLLEGHLGASQVASIDFSDYENATITHDMNVPVPSSIGTYDTVIDYGTIEHVFNIPVALDNVRRLCRIGGQILHVSPADNFCGHGFWQISPELFFSLYSEANGFTQTEIFLARRDRPSAWYRVAPPRPGRRIPLKTRGKTVVICRTVLSRHVAAPSVQQSDYVSEWAGTDKPLGSEHWFYHRIQYKYFRGISALNPHLTRVNVRQFSSPF